MKITRIIKGPGWTISIYLLLLLLLVLVLVIVMLLSKLKRDLHVFTPKSRSFWVIYVCETVVDFLSLLYSYCRRCCLLILFCSVVLQYRHFSFVFTAQHSCSFIINRLRYLKYNKWSTSTTLQAAVLLLVLLPPFND